MNESKFEGNNLKDKWLEDLNYKITKVDIIKSNLWYIPPNSFDTKVFWTSLTSLTIDNELNDATDTHVYQMVGKTAFNGLTALSALSISNMPSIDLLDKTSLDLLVDTLMTLKVLRVANTWQPSKLLSSSTLNKLTYVDLQWNNFGELNSGSFPSIADSCKTLILANSKIESITAYTFSSFTVLQDLYLQNNLLTTIPADAFNNLWSIAGFSVNMQANLFHCDCDLIEVQDMIDSHQTWFDGAVKCATPEEHLDVEIIAAILCSEDTEDASETTLMISEYSGTSLFCTLLPSFRTCTTVSPTEITEAEITDELITTGQMSYSFNY